MLEMERQEKERFQNALTALRKQNAVDAAILKSGGRNPQAIRSLLDMESITLDDEGKVTGLDLTELKRTDGYLFDQEDKKIMGVAATLPHTPPRISQDPSHMDYDTYKAWRSRQ